MDMARELASTWAWRQHDPLWHNAACGGLRTTPASRATIADIVNTGRGPQAGAINAALFLGRLRARRHALAAHRPVRLERRH
jgi:leucyl aminopeptidase